MRKIIVPILFLLCVLSACSSVDCPLENTVYTVYNLYKSTEKTDTLSDTLTISTQRKDGTDSILINKDVNITTFSLPISYTQPEDILIFRVSGATVLTDTVKIAKTNIPHFESVDCSASYFHKITGVSHTRNAIDSITINNANVTYDATKETFHIYFKSNI
jgi:hypothetical protein